MAPLRSSLVLLLLKHITFKIVATDVDATILHSSFLHSEKLEHCFMEIVWVNISEYLTIF